MSGDGDQRRAPWRSLWAELHGQLVYGKELVRVLTRWRAGMLSNSAIDVYERVPSTYVADVSDLPVDSVDDVDWSGFVDAPTRRQQRADAPYKARYGETVTVERCAPGTIAAFLRLARWRGMTREALLRDIVDEELKRLHDARLSRDAGEVSTACADPSPADGSCGTADRPATRRDSGPKANR